jgi:penicillin-binding protein 1A
MNLQFPWPERERVVGSVAFDRRPRHAKTLDLGGLILAIAAAAGLVAILLVPIGVGLADGANKLGANYASQVGKPIHLPRLPERSTIYAADGSVLERIARYNRFSVPLSKISQSTQDAVLSVEDSRFYSTGAIDPIAVIRAALTDLKAGHVVEGGSTITQQLAKDMFTGDALTFSRKIHEAIDAIRLAHTYSKQRILDAYLNEIYLGHGAYGIAAAGEYYFGVRSDELSLPQGALLAGLIRSPTFYDPLVYPQRALHRRNFVLSRLKELGWISKSVYQQSRKTPLGLSIHTRGVGAAGPDSYWTQYVISSFLSNPAFGTTVAKRTHLLYEGGLSIYTTLQPNLQDEADRVLQYKLGGSGMPQSSLVSITPSTGAIDTMAIGNDPWGANTYNLAVDPGGGRTAGSAFKVYTLATALEQGIDPNTVYPGPASISIPNCGGGATWNLSNAEPGGGSFPLWLATADSVNTVFAQVINQVGPANVAKVAQKMGITSPLDAVCPLTLGTSPVSPLQMASGYATLADHGTHCVPYAIAKVVGGDGQTIYTAKPSCTRALPRSVADEETAILEGVISFGTGTNAQIGRPEAGKTGTGQNYQDAWFCGYVPQIATAVWVGYAARETPMPAIPGYGAAFGGVIAAPVWHDYMLYATRNMPVRDFSPPPIPFGGPFGSSSTPVRRSPSPSPSRSP